MSGFYRLLFIVRIANYLMILTFLMVRIEIRQTEKIKQPKLFHLLKITKLTIASVLARDAHRPASGR